MIYLNNCWVGIKQQSAVRHVAPHGHIISIPSQPVFALPLCLAEKQHIPVLLPVLTRSGFEPTIYRTRDEHANHYTTDAVHGYSVFPHNNFWRHYISLFFIYIFFTIKLNIKSTIAYNFKNMQYWKQEFWSRYRKMLWLLQNFHFIEQSLLSAKAMHENYQ